MRNEGGSSSKILAAVVLITELLLYSEGLAAPNPGTTSQIRRIIRDRCSSCHAPDSGFDETAEWMVDDLPITELVRRGYIIRGNAEASSFYRLVKSGRMPKDGRLKPGDVSLIAEWINSLGAARNPLSFISEAKGRATIKNDFFGLAADDQPFIRYFSLVHLQNRNDIQVVRETEFALSKLLNSLSWKHEIVRPVRISKEAAIYRIDLRSYGWEPSDWESLAAKYPYRGGIAPLEESQERIQQITKSTEFIFRGDWFVSVASKPPFYYQLLDLPDGLSELEAQVVEVNSIRDLQRGYVLRGGTVESGVSQHNRVVERHPTRFGSYWKSYDFNGSTGRKNIRLHPLGPDDRRAFSLASTERIFEHAGGEMIFSLPNGLQGYYIAKEAGVRLDRAPIEIVSDPSQPDRAVVAGLSCMGCHVTGINRFEDQIHLEFRGQKDPNYSENYLSRVFDLYAGNDPLFQAFDEDEGRFIQALRKTGVINSDKDPILQAAQFYRRPLDSVALAAEFGVSTKTLLSVFGNSGSADGEAVLTALKSKATVKREQLEATYADLVSEIGFVVEAEKFRRTGAAGEEIRILAVRYGSEPAVRETSGKAFLEVVRQCNKRNTCRYLFSTATAGDPAPGELKEFAIEYACGSVRRTVRDSPISSGERLLLSCTKSGTIQITSASYGRNVDAALSGNSTEAVAASCNGGQKCLFKISTAVLGDPARNAGKAFEVAYECGTGKRLSAVVPPEANGKTVALSCQGS